MSNSPFHRVAAEVISPTRGQPYPRRKGSSPYGKEVTDGFEEPRNPSVMLTSPREGTPDPVVTPAELTKAAQRLAAGTGPVAFYVSIGQAF